MDLVIWTYIFGGATIFGFIVGVFSVWNGRMTRREIRQVIETGDRQTRELIERLTVHMQEMDRRHAELLTEVLRRAS